MSAPQLKLAYFDFGGCAELARLLFAFGGIAFDDNRVSMPEFGVMKASLSLGQLPIFKVDGIMFSQSLALARCAAKLCGLYPEDSIQALHVDMVSETLVDLTHGFVDIVFRIPDAAARAEKTTKYVAETAPKALAVLEKMAQGKFFAGDSATFADAQLLDMILNFKTNFPDFSLAVFPNLASVIESIKANVNVATYLAKPGSDVDWDRPLTYVGKVVGEGCAGVHFLVLSQAGSGAGVALDRVANDFELWERSGAEVWKTLLEVVHKA